jgi:hypothetical protein
MIDLKDLVKELALKGVNVELKYNIERGMFMIDLNTMAKSHGHLFENGNFEGRYDYVKKMDLSKDIDSFILDLCYEYNNCLHNRGMYNLDWANLCQEKGVNLDIFF